MGMDLQSRFIIIPGGGWCHGSASAARPAGLQRGPRRRISPKFRLRLGGFPFYGVTHPLLSRLRRGKTRSSYPDQREARFCQGTTDDARRCFGGVCSAASAFCEHAEARDVAENGSKMEQGSACAESFLNDQALGITRDCRLAELEPWRCG